MRIISLVSSILVTFFYGSLQASAKCNNEELSKISSSLSDAKMNLSKLEKIFNRINKCKAMDGEYAEGFNDEANKLLSKNWTEIIEAKELKNANFRNALIKSVSDGSEENTFDQICSSASGCVSSSIFCKDMNSQCEEIMAWIKANRTSQIHPTKIIGIYR